jgi:hypothetical protein
MYCLKERPTLTDGFSETVGKLDTFGSTFPENEAQPNKKKTAIITIALKVFITCSFDVLNLLIRELQLFMIIYLG